MRADRLVSIMMLLRARGKMTTYALAEELEVSRRTILRDVDALSGAGIPVYSEGGHGGGIALDEQYRLSLTGLKEAEVRALFVAQDTQLMRDLGLDTEATQAFLKLSAALPSLHHQTASHIRQRIHIDAAWWWWQGTQGVGFLEPLLQAVIDEHPIDVTYQRHDGRVAERRLEPYGLVAKGGIWYLVAAHDGEFRTYRVSRLQEVVVSEGTFARQADFEVATYWREQSATFINSVPFYHFTLRVHQSRMDFVRWYTPGTHETIGVADGEWLTVRFQVSNLESALMVVFGLGGMAKVVEPRELKLEMRERARALLAQEQ
jgi:predicted DNA-binding transcriptional regulator YafY